MGLFGANYNELEKQLLGQYVQSFTAMGMPDAGKTAKDMLNKAIEKSKQTGGYNLPHDFGDIILGIKRAEHPNIEKVAEIFRRTLPQKRAEGVKDEDIRWWWNLNDVERRMMLSVDELHRMSLFISEIESGKTPNEAGETVWRVHPIYADGDPDTKPESAPFELKREDFPVPTELKDRVNRYIEKRAKDDPEKFKQEAKNLSTFNALVRKEIKAGNI